MDNLVDIFVKTFPPNGISMCITVRRPNTKKPIQLRTSSYKCICISEWLLTVLHNCYGQDTNLCTVPQHAFLRVCLALLAQCYRVWRHRTHTLSHSTFVLDPEGVECCYKSRIRICNSFIRLSSLETFGTCYNGLLDRVGLPAWNFKDYLTLKRRKTKQLRILRLKYIMKTVKEVCVCVTLT